MLKRIICIFLFLLAASIILAQKNIYIQDSISGQALKDVQLIINNEVFYTNEDGRAWIPESTSEIRIYSATYRNKAYAKIKDTVLLQPVYQEIPEVLIKKNSDLLSIINNVLYRDYKKYYLADSEFLIHLKQKAHIEVKIHNLLSGDLNLWTKNTVYNYAAKPKSYYDFIQMTVKNIRYNKTQENTAFNAVELKPSDFVTALFMNVKLSHMDTEIKNSKTPVKCHLAYEDRDFKKFAFSYNTPFATTDGFLSLSKADHIITTLEIKYEFNNSNFSDKINANGKIYSTVTTSTTARYDEYKKNGQYFPARVLLTGSGNNNIDQRSYQFTFEQSIIFNQQKTSKLQGYKNKIDLSKPISQNSVTQEVTGYQTLLSKEEKAFVNER